MVIEHYDEVYRTNIRDYLIRRAHAVQVDAKLNLLNLAGLSEDFYTEFLNLLLDLRFENANASERNKAGIDGPQNGVVQMLFSRDNSATASFHEMSYANLDGAEFIYGKQVVRITAEGPVFRESILDETGQVVGCSEEETLVSADSVIIAISQRPKDILTAAVWRCLTIRSPRWIRPGRRWRAACYKDSQRKTRSFSLLATGSIEIC